MNYRLKIILGFLGIVTVIILPLIYFGVISFNPIDSMPDYGEATDFTLPTTRGDNYTLSEDTGKVRIMTFMYTKCTQGCGVEVTKMNLARKLVDEGGLSSKVKFLVVDFDFLYDNMTVLETYAAPFIYVGGQSWEFMLGDKNQTESITDDYNFWYNLTMSPDMMNMTSAISTSQHEGHTMTVVYDHIFELIIIDPKGHIRGYTLGLEWEEETLYNQIEFLIDEYEA